MSFQGNTEEFWSSTLDRADMTCNIITIKQVFKVGQLDHIISIHFITNWKEKKRMNQWCLCFPRLITWSPQPSSPLSVRSSFECFRRILFLWITLFWTSIGSNSIKPFRNKMLFGCAAFALLLHPFLRNHYREKNSIMPCLRACPVVP